MKLQLLILIVGLVTSFVLLWKFTVCEWGVLPCPGFSTSGVPGWNGVTNIWDDITLPFTFLTFTLLWLSNYSAYKPPKNMVKTLVVLLNSFKWVWKFKRENNVGNWHGISPPEVSTFLWGTCPVGSWIEPGSILWTLSVIDGHFSYHYLTWIQY